MEIFQLGFVIKYGDKKETRRQDRCNQEAGFFSVYGSD